MIALGLLAGPYAGSRRRRESVARRLADIQVCRDSNAHARKLGAKGSAKRPLR